MKKLEYYLFESKLKYYVLKSKLAIQPKFSFSLNVSYFSKGRTKRLSEIKLPTYCIYILHSWTTTRYLIIRTVCPKVQMHSGNGPCVGSLYLVESCSVLHDLQRRFSVNIWEGIMHHRTFERLIRAFVLRLGLRDLKWPFIWHFNFTCFLPSSVNVGARRQLAMEHDVIVNVQFD